METSTTFYRIPLSRITRSAYTKKEGTWERGFLLINDTMISNVNVVGTVISKDAPSERHRSVTIDDSTGTLGIRVFDKEAFASIDDAQIGSLVRVVGQIREYRDEVYITPSIIRPLSDKDWLRVHTQQTAPFMQVKTQTEATQEIVEDENPKSFLEIIRQLDSGDGAQISDVIERLGGQEDGKRIVSRLIANGDIFEIRPGYVKTLY